MKLLQTLSLAFSLVTVPALASAANDHAAKRPAASQERIGSRKPAQRVAKRFAKLDANADGVLSLAEVKGTRLERRFAALDTDSDQSLSRAELLAGIKAHQGFAKGGRGGEGHQGWSTGKADRDGDERGRDDDQDEAKGPKGDEQIADHGQRRGQDETKDSKRQGKRVGKGHGKRHAGRQALPQGGERSR